MGAAGVRVAESVGCLNIPGVTVLAGEDKSSLHPVSKREINVRRQMTVRPISLAVILGQFDEASLIDVKLFLEYVSFLRVRAVESIRVGTRRCH